MGVDDMINYYLYQQEFGVYFTFQLCTCTGMCSILIATCTLTFSIHA